MVLRFLKGENFTDDYRTICPEEHTDVCDGSPNKPFWRLPEQYRQLIKFCPYCGKEIDYSGIDREIKERKNGKMD